MRKRRERWARRRAPSPRGKLFGVCELDDVSDLSSRGREREGRKLEDPFCSNDQLGKAIRPEILPRAKHAAVRSEKGKIDGETHPEGMDPRTGNKVEARPRTERLTA